MQRHQSMVNETLKEFIDQIHIELADAAAHEFAIEHQSGPTGNIQHDAGQCFIQRHIRMPIAPHAFFVTDRLIERLSQCDADIFHSVMGIDVQITFSLNEDIHQTMPGDLVEHVIEKWQPGFELDFAGAVKHQLNGDLCFLGIA